MTYRYDDRRSTMHCPRCRKLISKNSGSCINCGLRYPKVYKSTPILKDLIADQISFVDPIVIACFVLYVLALAMDISGALSFEGIFSALSPTTQSLFQLGMGGTIPMSMGRWWTLITATYLHGGVVHILFNMLWLRQIGPLVEELFGVSRFLLIYTMAGLTGSVVTVLAGTELFVGASGAIFGLFGALIYYGWARGGTFGSAIFRQMLIWAAIGFVLGFMIEGIDNWGHLGGFLGGTLAAFVLGYQEKIRQTLTHHIIALLTLAGILVCFAIVALDLVTGLF